MEEYRRTNSHEHDGSSIPHFSANPIFSDDRCFSYCQSVGYDSGICLSNYKSTDGTLLSRDGAVSSSVLENLQNLQLRDEGHDPRVVATTASSTVQCAPIKPACEERERQPTSACFEDELFEQDEEGDTRLHLAIVEPNPGATFRILEMTRIPEYLDIQNKTYMHTPLHLAVLTSQPPLVRALLLSGASVTSRDRHGNTALHLACKQNDMECVRQLTMPLNESEKSYLWNVCDTRGTPLRPVKPMQSQEVDLMNYEGEMSLHMALFSGNEMGIKIFDYLVTACSANINAKDGKCGYTVLHHAVKMKDIEMVKFLLQYPQLAINDCCYSGNTALDIAIILGLHQMERLLRMAGGISTERSETPDLSSDDSQVDDFDDLMIGGLRLKA